MCNDIDSCPLYQYVCFDGATRYVLIYGGWQFVLNWPDNVRVNHVSVSILPLVH